MKVLLGIWVGILLLTPAYSQDKIEPRLDIQYVYTNMKPALAEIQVRKRVERRFFPMAGLKVKVYFNEEVPENEIGEVVTNARGLATAEFPAAIMQRWDSLSFFDLFATVEATDSTEEVTESIAVEKARVVINGEIIDDQKKVTVLVEQFSQESWNAAGETELKLFVRRDFGKLFLSDELMETDESGLFEMPFEMEIPGDSQGRISIAAMVEDHEQFGTLYAYTNKNWGVPTTDDNSEFNKRSLWASRDKTPLWLLIFPNLIILGVWGAIGYLAWQIYLLKKLGKQV